MAAPHAPPHPNGRPTALPSQAGTLDFGGPAERLGAPRSLTAPEAMASREPGAITVTVADVDVDVGTR